MNWEAISSISDLIAAIAVIVSLLYVGFQVKQSNILAQGQTRRDMMDLGQREIHTLLDDPTIWDLMIKDKLTHEERVKLQVWLVAAMRLREFEWSQNRFGIVDDDTYAAHKEIITLQLGTARTRAWWKTRGRTAFNAVFVEFVDELLENRPLTDYWDLGDNW